MTRRWFRFALALAGLIMLANVAGDATAQSRDRVSEEFSQNYPLSANGRVSLKNINGSVRVTAWDRNEVRVEATKWAYNPERLAEVKIQIEATDDSVRIITEYPQRNLTWNHGDGDKYYNNPASVEFTLSIPRAARIDKIDLINGDLALEGVTGEVRASSINGEVTGKNLTGEVKLSTINGRLGFEFDSAAQARRVNLSSVNGAVDLTLSSDTEAEITASTVHGLINNDLGLPVRKGRHVGRSLGGLLGSGGSRIELKNVNGSIRIERANDGRRQSSVTNTLKIDRDGERDDSDGDIERESAREMTEAEREMREAEREMRNAMREIERDMRQSEREADRAVRRAERQIDRSVDRRMRERN